MNKHRITFIRQWRLHRGYSLAQLAEKVPVDKGNLSKIERGLLPYNQSLIERLAVALMTDISSLLTSDPSNSPSIQERIKQRLNESPNFTVRSASIAAGGSTANTGRFQSQSDFAEQVGAAQNIIDRPPHYLREWRKHRSLTQEQVIDRLIAQDNAQLPQTSASLSRLETGKQPYGERILEALAEIYQCKPWELIGRTPDMADVEPKRFATAIPTPQNDLDCAPKIPVSLSQQGKTSGVNIADIRERISHEMGRQALTPRSLSLAAGLSATAVRDVNNRTDNPGVGTLQRLADALKVDSHWLIFGENPHFSSNQLFLLIQRIPDSKRGLAVRVLEAFVDEDENLSS